MPLAYGGDMVPERLLLAGILLASGCNSSPPVPTAASSAPSAAPAPSNEDTALATARAAAGKLGASVKTRLVDAMNAGGRAQRRRGLLRRPLGGGAGRPLSCLSATAALRPKWSAQPKASGRSVEASQLVVEPVVRGVSCRRRVPRTLGRAKLPRAATPAAKHRDEQRGAGYQDDATDHRNRDAGHASSGGCEDPLAVSPHEIVLDRLDRLPSAKALVNLRSQRDRNR